MNYDLNYSSTELQANTTTQQDTDNIFHNILSCCRARADPSWHWAGGGLHPGQASSLINLRVFRLWEEAGETGENPFRHGENMQTPHGAVSQPRNDSSRLAGSNPEPSYYDTVCPLEHTYT